MSDFSIAAPLGYLCVVDDHLELRVDGAGEHGVGVGAFFLGDLPNGDLAVVAAAHQKLRVLVEGPEDARDRILVPVLFVTPEGHRRVDLHVPQPDAAVLVTRGHQTAVGQEGHAGDLGVRRTLHHSRHVHVLGVPEADRVVQTARDQLRVVGDPLPILLA